MEALGVAASTLDKGRCIEAELQATSILAASLLCHSPANESSVDVSSMPGAIRDAWVVISASSSAVDEGTASRPTDPSIAKTVIDAAKNVDDLPLGRGQMGRSVHTASLAGCLQREAFLAHQVQEQREKEGPTLKRTFLMATTVPNYENIWLQVFDERLRQIHSYHARHQLREEWVVNKRHKMGNPAADGYDLASSASEILAPLQQGALFSEEEVMGKYLDLEPIFDATVDLFKDLAQVKKETVFTLPDFVAFLTKGSLSKTIAEADKLRERKRYVRFLAALQSYLEAFMKKVSPLATPSYVMKAAVDDFVKEWKQFGGVAGWERKPDEACLAEPCSISLAGANVHSTKSEQKPSGIDLAPYNSPEDLEKACDVDQLKAELFRLGLKCGGTASERAKRLFLTKNTPLEQLPKKIFAKRKPSIETSPSGFTTSAVAAKSWRRVDIARREASVMALLDHLRPTLEATLRRLERRQAQTELEREQELEEELHGSAIEEKSKEKKSGDDDESEDEEETIIYNPKGVPLGWDGKPIPYWLFKLHGLNHFYQCEICGNESYRGRRNFELHFTEAKHSYGMKCLGIPNTVCFFWIMNGSVPFVQPSSLCLTLFSSFIPETFSWCN